MTLYKLKPLQWEQVRGPEHENGECWVASAVFGLMVVYQAPGIGRVYWSHCLGEYHDQGKLDYDSIEAGKAAAEEFYRERLRAALEPVDETPASVEPNDVVDVREGAK